MNTLNTDYTAGRTTGRFEVSGANIETNLNSTVTAEFDDFYAGRAGSKNPPWIFRLFPFVSITFPDFSEASFDPDPPRQHFGLKVSYGPQYDNWNLGFIVGTELMNEDIIPVSTLGMVQQEPVNIKNWVVPLGARVQVDWCWGINMFADASLGGFVNVGSTESFKHTGWAEVAVGFMFAKNAGLRLYMNRLIGLKASDGFRPERYNSAGLFGAALNIQLGFTPKRVFLPCAQF